MATKTPQSPKPSPGPNPRSRNVRRQPPRPAAPASATAVLSPSFSRAPFRAADALSSSSPDEHPCVTLFEWWLVRVEEDEQKIAVSGFTERNQTVRIFTSAPIVKRYEACTLETEDGIVVLIHGSLNISRMRENGFSPEVCEKFLIGFPFWWESCNVFYPKSNDSHIGSQPSSSNTSNSRVDSTQFYLEKFQLGKFLDSVGSSFIGNLLNNAKSFSGDSADADAFQECSYLSNGTPRFEECNCDTGISTKEKAAASDDGSKGSAVCKEVDNVEIDFIVGSTSKERGHVDIDLNISLALTEECTSDETYKERGNQNDIMHLDAREQEAGSHLFDSNLIYSRFIDHMPSDVEDGNGNAGSSVDLGSKYFLATVPPERANCSTEIAGDLANTPPKSRHRTPVASLKNQGCWKRTQHITLNEKEKPVGPREEQRSVHEVLQGATRSPIIKSPIPYAYQSPLTRAKAKALSVSTPESLKLRRTKSGRVLVPVLDPGCQRIVYDRDGLISGVTGLELQPPLKGSKSETPVGKKRAH